MTNEIQAPLYLTLSPTSYEIVIVYYLVLSRCCPVSSLYSQFLDLKKRVLGLRERRTAAARMRWKKNCLILERQLGGVGGIESIDKGLEDNWWGGGGFIHKFVIIQGQTCFGKIIKYTYGKM